jgi:hypothetical protein
VVALVGVALFGAYRQYGGRLSPGGSQPPSAAADSPSVPAAEQPPPPPEAVQPDPVQPEPTEAKSDEPKQVAPSEAKVTPSEIKPQRPAPAPVPTNGAFQLTATPAGAIATFDRDASLKCVTPCSMTLPSGRHTFLVQFAGYRDAQRIIDIPHDTGLIVNLERMSGMLTITTNPPGLSIVIDGQEQARKSPGTFVLLPGPHKLEIVKGSERHSLAIEIHDGSTIERNVDLSQ